MLNLKRIEFGAAGRYVEKQVISFEGVKGLVLADGVNLNSGGSSGSGKTTWLSMIDFNWDINSTPATKLQSRLTKEKIWIDGYYDWNGKEVILSRKGTKKSITIDGEKKSNSAALVEEMMTEIMGMPPSVFKKITHREQKSDGYFLSMANTEASKFLSDCLGIQKIEIVADEAAKKAILLLKEIEELQLSINIKTDNLDSNKITLNTISTPDVVDFSNMDNMSVELNGLQGKWNHTEDESKWLLDKMELERPLQPQVKIDIPDEYNNLKKKEQEIRLEIQKMEGEKSAKVTKLQATLYGLNETYSTLQKQQNNLLLLSKESNRLSTEINGMKEDVCPTCEQDWDKLAEYRDAKIENLKKIEKEMSGYPNNLVSLSTSAKARIDKLTNEVNLINAEKIPLETSKALEQTLAAMSSIDAIVEKKKAEISMEYQKKLNAFNLSKSELQQTRMAISRELSDKMNSLQAAIQLLNSQKDGYDAQVKQAENTRKSMEEQNSAISLEIQKLEKDLSDKKIDYDLEFNIGSSLGKEGYLNAIFEETLDLIGEEATYLLGRVPNTTNTTISFKTTKETNKGKSSKKEINAYVTCDGDEAPIKTLSGGERTVFDLVVDLAVIKIVEERTGNIPGWLILDESFEGLGPVEKEQIIELLKVFSFKRKDHAIHSIIFISYFT